MRLIDADALTRLFDTPIDYSDAYVKRMIKSMPTIETYTKENRWISEQERLPKNDDQVLAWYMFDMDIARYNAKKDQWEIWSIDDFDGMAWLTVNGVTHWMPLPEPPREE